MLVKVHRKISNICLSYATENRYKNLKIINTNTEADTHYLWHTNWHHVLFLCGTRGQSGGPLQDPGVNPSLRVGVWLLQPLLAAGQILRGGGRVGANPLQGKVHGGLWDPEPHAALEAVPFVGGAVVYKLWLLQGKNVVSRHRSKGSPYGFLNPVAPPIRNSADNVRFT